MAAIPPAMMANLPAGFLARLQSAAFKALIEIEVTGTAAARYYLELDGKPALLPELPKGRHPDIILTGDSFSLTALLEGRLSFRDALISERVALAGDVAKIVQLKQALMPMSS